MQINTDMLQNEKGKKRKLVDEQQSTPKRTRLVEQPSTPKASKNTKRKGTIAPPSPSQAQIRTRDASRVKDYPAGNVATSAAQIGFLRRLCGLSKFGSMVDYVQTVVRIPSFIIVSLLIICI